MQKKFIYFIVFLIFTAIIPAALSQNTDSGEIIPSESKAIPYITFLDANGKERNLDEYRGKVLLVNFWAMWCFPCKQEMPALAQLQKEFGGMGLQVLPLSNDYNGVEDAKKFYKDNKITGLDVFVDAKSSAFRAFRLRGLPTTIIIDRRGMEAGRVMGYIDWNSENTKNYIKKLLKEPT